MGGTTRHDPAVLALARRQHGLVTRAQLRDTGLSDKAIEHRIGSGRLFAVHRGVFAVGRPDLTREGRWLAAVLACGDGAAASHITAALLWGILERGDERPHATVPTTAGRTAPRGVALHRSSTLAARDVVTRAHIPVTALFRTLVDLAATNEGRVVKEAIRQAERLHHADLGALRAYVADPPTARGPARLRRVLDAFAPGVESELEQRFLDLCRRHRLPPPLVQVPIGAYRVDFLWPAVRLVVETDGRATHDGAVAFLDDRVKDRTLKAAGYEVLRFTWAEVTRRPAAVAAELRAAIARRGAELAARG